MRDEGTGLYGNGQTTCPDVTATKLSMLASYRPRWLNYDQRDERLW
jgi:hypothetical protein